MNATFDAMMAAMGYRPCACENCAHSLKSVAYPQVYCPVKDKPVNLYERCSAHMDKGKA